MAKRKSRRGSGGGKPSTDKKAAPSRPTAGRRRRGINRPVLVLAALGMVLAGYLALTSWLGASPAYCTEGSGCDIVQNSRWGTLLGLPIAAWGFGAYAALAYVAWRVRDVEWHWKLSWTIALVGIAYSVYLTAVSLLVIGATCYYCLGSLALMAAIFAVVLWQRPVGMAGFSWPGWVGQTGALAAVIIVAAQLHYSGVFSTAAGPEDPYLTALAQHLTDSGAIFYGAYW